MSRASASRGSRRLARRLRAFSIVLACSGPFACAASAADVAAEPEASPSAMEVISREMEQIFRRSSEAVVRIEATDKHGPLSGTGFFIDPHGTIYTSYTIGGESAEIVVSRGDRKYPARRLISDSRSGIAILKVEVETPFLPTGNSRGLRPGSPVMTVGFPMDLDVSPSFGVIGGFDLKHLDRYFCTTHIRANVPVQRGQGGAPLLDFNGQVVGILISSLDQGGGCMALPIEAAEKVRMDFVRFGEARPGWLGVDVDQASVPEKGSSARIKALLEGAPAAASGLQPGDILLRIGRVNIAEPEDVLNAAFFLTSGDMIPMVVVRDGETVQLEVRAGVHPSPGGNPLHALAAPTPGPVMILPKE